MNIVELKEVLQDYNNSSVCYTCTICALCRNGMGTTYKCSYDNRTCYSFRHVIRGSIHYMIEKLYR